MRKRGKRREGGNWGLEKKGDDKAALFLYSSLVGDGKSQPGS